VKLVLGNCLDVVRAMPDNSVDSIVTDPPYGLNFMGKKWDYDVPSVEVWSECLRVLKPGGYLLAFAGTRTQHRMAVRIEDAGFEIRDMIAWVYGSGFPKSLDVSKAIDKAAGISRATEYQPNYANATFGRGLGGGKHGAQSEPPATEAAQQWQGWGTALKPALEPITVARKPLVGTVAANVLEHGTGAINIDGCRIGTGDRRMCGSNNPQTLVNGQTSIVLGLRQETRTDAGRWPANLIHDGSDEVLQQFPTTKAGGNVSGNEPSGVTNGIYGEFEGRAPYQAHADAGSAARFFYCAKTSGKDRDEGLEHLQYQQAAGLPMRSAGGERGGEGLDSTSTDRNVMRKNTHPTVKPTELMRYLCRLVTPPKGTILDPFMGSGSTGKAAVSENFNFIGIELDERYLDIAKKRIEYAIYGDLI